MTQIHLNMYHALALGAAMYFLGSRLTQRIPALRRFCIPAPLVGGACFALLNTVLYASGLALITFDDTLQSVFMILFFATVGFTVSIPLLVKSGKAVLVLLGLSIVMIGLQNLLGGGVMLLFGKSPLYGIGCGSVALIGGPGTAAAIGPDLEAAGAVGGTAAALAAATFGLVFGSLLGGPAAKKLIERHHLREPLPETADGAPDGEDERFSSDGTRFVRGFLLLCFSVGVGNWVSTLLTDLCGFSFPAYIGAMLVAVAVRNVCDGVKIDFPAEELDTMGSMFLSIFLAMALSGLKLWQLIDLAAPMLVCLAGQVVLMWVFSVYVVFPLMGRDYDAAMMSAGFIGFAMGATSNAMANMQAVSRRYGPSPEAYFVIPMVGGLFIDFFNAALVALNIAWWA